jgi:uncharacterized protein Yka (UPF0111/DUF47 family)
MNEVLKLLELFKDENLVKNLTPRTRRMIELYIREVLKYDFMYKLLDRDKLSDEQYYTESYNQLFPTNKFPRV